MVVPLPCIIQEVQQEQEIIREFATVVAYNVCFDGPLLQLPTYFSLPCTVFLPCRYNGLWKNLQPAV